MKIRLIILFLSIAIGLHATNYYVKTGGSDAEAGTSDATAWATITKVNSVWAAGTLAPGDSILFRKGDTFDGTVTVTESGTFGNPIVIGAYGTGDRPIINGFSTASSWTSVGGGIYYAALTLESIPNMVAIDGVNTPMGRFPDSGYLIIDSSVGTTSITDSELNSAVTDWGGAELVIRKNRWITDRCLITNHTNQTLTYTTLTTYTTGAGYGYFIQNDIRTLTTFGEWFWDTSTNRLYMYFGAETPSSYVVKCAARNNNINAVSYDYITIDGLHLQGANFASANINRSGGNTSNYIIINNCEMSFSGNHGVYSQYPVYITINNCDINNINVNGILFAPSTTSSSNSYNITNNTIDSVYMYPGMGTKVVEGQGNGISVKGPNTIISGNTVTNIGYIPINTGSTNLIVRNNHIDTYGFVMDDCGGIYIFNDRTLNKRVYNNVVLNAIGAGLGTPGGVTSSSANAFYSDGGSSDIIWTDNTAGNIAGQAFHANVPVNQTFSDNTIYQCPVFLGLWKFGDAGFFDATGIFISGLTIKNNVFISTLVDDNLPEVIRYQNSSNETYNGDLDDEIAHFGTIDSNYYYTNTECHVHILYYPSDIEAAPRSIARWTADYGHDANSVIELLDIYELNSIGSNLLTNGTFNANIDGWTTNTGSSAAWDSDELGDGGCIALTSTIDNYEFYWWSNGNTVTTAISGGAISSSNHYILRFLGKSAVDEKTMALKLYSTGTGYPKQRFFTVGNTNTQKDVLFSYPADVGSGATMRISLADDPITTYLDNVGLYVANVTLRNPDDYIHLLYNTSSITETYVLSAPMVDAQGTTYPETAKIAPWEGLVLIGYGTTTKGGGTSPGLSTVPFGVNNAGNLLVDKNGIVIIIQ